MHPEVRRDLRRCLSPCTSEQSANDPGVRAWTNPTASADRGVIVIATFTPIDGGLSVTEDEVFQIAIKAGVPDPAKLIRRLQETGGTIL